MNCALHMTIGKSLREKKPNKVPHISRYQIDMALAANSDRIQNQTKEGPTTIGLEPHLPENLTLPHVEMHKNLDSRHQASAG